MENSSPLNITSSKNPKIKKALSLFKKSNRDETGLFLIEGYRELLRAVESNVQFESFFYSESFFLGENNFSLIEKIKASLAIQESSEQEVKNLYSVDEKVFQKLSYRDRPDGLIAIAYQNKKGLGDLKELIRILKDNSEKSDLEYSEKKPPFFVIVEAIEKPGNLGTILRSSDGAGADCVIVADPLTDIFNPNVVRASCGTLFSMPTFTSTSNDIIELLKKEKIQIVATTPDTKSFYTEIDLKKPVAIVMGTEQLGLSDLWLKKADLSVKIPMLGIADSLNVAQATTLMLYEVRRQRS